MCVCVWGGGNSLRGKLPSAFNFVRLYLTGVYGIYYTQFRYEEDAENAVLALNNRWFNGQPIHSELSPVTDFREACCRQYEMG